MTELASTPDAEARYLNSLSAFATRSFSSTNEALQAVLELISEQLRLRSSFLTAIDPGCNNNRVLQAHNQPGGCDVPPGADLPLDDTF